MVTALSEFPPRPASRLARRVTRLAATRLRPWLMILIPILLAQGAGAAAATRWRSIKQIDGPGTVKIEVAGAPFVYHLLTDEKPTTFNFNGPRKLKIISRYLFAAGESGDATYLLRVLIDGVEVLARSFTARLKEDVAFSGQPDRPVAALHRTELQIGRGGHTVTVFAHSAGQGGVGARFFRQTKRKAILRVPYSPQQFDALYHLETASGKLYTYYHFGADQPLTFSVIGPAKLQVFTRLDFDHTMNGSQAYSLEVLRDGELWKVFHFDAEKHGSAVYVERQDILPGTRQTLYILVPRGSHRFEIRCVRPAGCGVAAQIRIPKAQLLGGRK